MIFRHIYLESLYLYFIFICFSECKNEKSNGQHFHGRYTQGIKDFELLIPRKINQDGSFHSFTIPHIYQRRNNRLKREDEDDTVRYALDFAGKVHNVELVPNHEFLSPAFVIETHRGPKLFQEGDLRKPRDTQCHYTGFVLGDDKSRVALSVCDGLAGIIKTRRGNYFIEPAKYSKPNEDGQHLHVIYQHDSDSIAKSIHQSDSKTCGFTGDWKNKYINQSQKYNYSPVKRSIKSKHRYLAALIVADKKFLAHHNGSDVETYILTIMNMVSDYFHDASIGQLIDVVIVRLMLLEKEHKDIDIEVSHSANKTLQSFCKWQMTVNPADPLHPNHHDVAILLTRQDLCAEKSVTKGNVEKVNSCSIQGLANSAAVCNFNKSCTVNEDNGLILSVVVTHELGHLLGCQHDQKDVNGCKPTAPDGSYYVMAPSIQFHTSQWSNCSNTAVEDMFDAGFGDCLLNAPVDHSFPSGAMLPGAMFDGLYQCRLQFGPGAETCNVLGDIFCDTLLCRPKGKAACYSLGAPAADGTPCGPNKWCYDRKCVGIGRRPGAVDGGWGEWSPWSACSRTCGGGVSSQERNCDRPVPRKRGRFCLGERKHYQMCSTAPCNSTTTFREHQCAEFNSKTFNGARHRWVPYRPRAAHDRCALLCINEAGRHKTLHPRVIDGTSCRPGTRDVCIAGACTEVGCDWQVASGAVIDRCGVCRGDGTQCNVTEEVYKNNESNSKRVSTTRSISVFTKVPRGARNVHLSLTKPSPRATVAISNEGGSKFYLNGGDDDSADGEFAVDNVKGVYSHPEPFRGHAVIAGPTPVALNLALVSSGGQFRHVSAAFGFSVRVANATYLPKFAWEFLGWDECSVRCGGGTRLGQAQCVEATAGEVSRSFCQPTERPTPKTQACNREACPTRWVTGPWGACDSANAQHRTVTCWRQAARVDREDVEEPAFACEKKKKPDKSRPCAKKQRRRSSGTGQDPVSTRGNRSILKRGILDREELSNLSNSLLKMCPLLHSEHLTKQCEKGDKPVALFRGPNRNRPKPNCTQSPNVSDPLTSIMESLVGFQSLIGESSNGSETSNCTRPKRCGQGGKPVALFRGPIRNRPKPNCTQLHSNNSDSLTSIIEYLVGVESLNSTDSSNCTKPQDTIEELNGSTSSECTTPLDQRFPWTEGPKEVRISPPRAENHRLVLELHQSPVDSELRHSKVKRDDKTEEGKPTKKLEEETLTSEETVVASKESEGKEEETAVADKEGETSKTKTKNTGLARLKDLMPKKKKEQVKNDEQASKGNSTKTQIINAITSMKLPKLKSLKKTTGDGNGKNTATSSGSSRNTTRARYGSAFDTITTNATGTFQCKMIEVCPANETKSELVEDHLAPEAASLIIDPVSVANTNTSAKQGSTHKLSDEAEEVMGDEIPDVQVDTRHKKVYHGDDALKKTKELEAEKHKE